MCYNQTGDISTFDGTPLKLVDKFTYLGSSVASTEKDIDTRLTKAWTAINRLSIIWKSDLSDKMKRSFFQAAVASILLYGCTTWTLAKRLEKKLDGTYTRMLRTILNKSWRQHLTRHQLYGHLPPITKNIQVWRTRHAGHCWRSRNKLISDVLLWTPTHGRAKQDDQHEHTFSNYVKIRYVVQTTCQRRWTIKEKWKGKTLILQKRKMVLTQRRIKNVMLSVFWDREESILWFLCSLYNYKLGFISSIFFIIVTIFIE